MVSSQQSLTAYRQARMRAGRNHKLIAEALARRGAMSDREIEKATGLRINVVTARRNELVKMGIVRKHGLKRDQYTGMQVTVWMV